MAQVITQLIVDASGAKMGVAEFTAAMDKAKRSAAEGGEATASAFERAQARWTASLAKTDPAIKAQIALERDLARQRQINADALRLGIATQDAANAQLEKVRQQHQAYAATLGNVGAATQKMAGQTGLARHEMINLSRQAQDVAVSLGSGQSFGTVLLQQGTQIADVFANSTGSIRGFASQAIDGLRSIITPARLAFGAVVAGAAAAVLAMNDYLERQRDIQRGLIGAGRFSGASVGDINQIGAERSSATGFSINEARAAALEFAKTGQIHKRVIGEMVDTTRNFAIVTGQSAQEAAGSLSKAFTNMGALDALNQQFRFLDGSSRTAIERLLMFGKTTEAAALANQRLSDILKDAPSTLSASEKGWSAIGNAIAFATSKLGEYAARASGLQPKSRDDRASEIEGEIGRLQRLSTGNIFGDTSGADKAAAQIEKLRGLLILLNEEKAKISRRDDFNKMSLDATAAAQAAQPLLAQIQQVEAALHKMNEARNAGLNIPGLQQSLLIETQKLEALRQQSVMVTDLATKYPGMSIETAKQLENLNAQNATLGNMSDEEKIITQELARQTELRLQNKTAAEAAAIAAAERANAETALRAREEAQAEQDAARATEQRARAAQVAANANITAANAAQRMADILRNTSTIGNNNGAFINRFRTPAEEEANFQRTGSVFATDPGLASTIDDNPGAEALERARENAKRAWDEINNLANADPIHSVNQLLQGSGIQGAINSILQGAIGSITGQYATQYLGSLNNLLPQDQRQSNIQRQMDLVRQQPITLEREALLQQLTQSLDELKGSVDNLSDVFSPFYSQDPRKSNLGFRAFAGGGIMTPWGEMPLKKYDGGGVARSPQVAVFGEGSTPEAYVPVPSGRIPVEMRGGNDNRPSATINQTINFNGAIDQQMAGRIKRTSFQAAQAAKRELA